VELSKVDYFSVICPGAPSIAAQAVREKLKEATTTSIIRENIYLSLFSSV
jgi:hypothetical protein